MGTPNPPSQFYPGLPIAARTNNPVYLVQEQPISGGALRIPGPFCRIDRLIDQLASPDVVSLPKSATPRPVESLGRHMMLARLSVSTRRPRDSVSHVVVQTPPAQERSLPIELRRSSIVTVRQPFDAPTQLRHTRLGDGIRRPRQLP